MFDKFKNWFSGNLMKIYPEFGELIIQLNRFDTISQLNQLCVRYEQDNNYLIFIPTWRTRFEGFDKAFSREMYLIAWRLGFDSKIIPDEFANFSIAQIAEIDRIVADCKSFNYDATLAKKLVIYNLGNFFALGTNIDMTIATKKDIEFFIDNVDKIANIFEKCFARLRW